MQTIEKGEIIMKIAVPTKETIVDDHFGHCEVYTIFTISGENTIDKTEFIPSPQGCGCKSNIASTLSELGVTVMLAGNMGDGALNILTNKGIRVIRGCSGNTRKAAEEYIKGRVEDSGEGCHLHSDNDGGHQCNH